MRALIRIGISWLPLGIAISGLCLLTYLGVEQSIRQTFNEIPVQMAEDTARMLGQGADLRQFAVGAYGQEVDIRVTLEPFIVIYNEQGSVVGGNGVIDEILPTPPHGVFERAEKWRWGSTWQPEDDVRIAAAIVPYSAPDGTAGFVLAGRNMRLMEDHTNHIGWLVVQAWLALVLITFFATGVGRYVE